VGPWEAFVKRKRPLRFRHPKVGEFLGTRGGGNGVACKRGLDVRTLAQGGRVEIGIRGKSVEGPKKDAAGPLRRGLVDLTIRRGAVLRKWWVGMKKEEEREGGVFPTRTTMPPRTEARKRSTPSIPPVKKG